ncbi:MAG: hypothetical protein ACRD2W_18370 [Acidimicrobiales bacterium]
MVEELKPRLGELGYTPLTTVNVMRLVAHLSTWLDGRGLGVADLSDGRVDEYFRWADGPRAAALR